MQIAKITVYILCNDMDERIRRFYIGWKRGPTTYTSFVLESLQQPQELEGLGLGSARQANATFLSTLGWRVLTNPNALWSRVLIDKYCKVWYDIDMFEPKANLEGHHKKCKISV